MNLGNKLLALIILPFVAILGLALLFLVKVDVPKTLESDISKPVINHPFELPVFVTEIIDFPDYASIPKYECKEGVAYSKELARPVPIRWQAKTTGAVMQSGLYYALEKIPTDSEYPVFGGILSTSQDLDGKYVITGMVKSIECGSYSSIFGNQARPEVTVEKIEPLN